MTMLDYLKLKFPPGGSMPIGAYEATNHNPGWWQFSLPEFRDKTMQRTGWKFHLSVDPEDMPCAAAIVFDVCRKHGVAVFKMAIPSTAVAHATQGNDQIGKSIVLYDTSAEPVFDSDAKKEQWRQILQEIEDRFQQDIPPIEPVRKENGEIAPVNTDRRVRGSKYAYYRNDKPLNGVSAGSDDVRLLPAHMRHNPNGYKDPFDNLVIMNPELHAPPAPRDNVSIIGRQNWRQKEIYAVFGLRSSEFRPGKQDELAQTLTDSGWANRVCYSEHINQYVFEVDCPKKENFEWLRSFLRKFNSNWMCKQSIENSVVKNKTIAAVETTSLSSIDIFALERALKAEKFHVRKYRVNKRDAASKSGRRDYVYKEVGTLNENDIGKLHGIMTAYASRPQGASVWNARGPTLSCG